VKKLFKEFSWIKEFEGFKIDFFPVIISDSFEIKPAFLGFFAWISKWDLDVELKVEGLR